MPLDDEIQKDGEMWKAVHAYETRPRLAGALTIVLLATPIFTERKTLDHAFYVICESLDKIAWPMNTIHAYDDPSQPRPQLDDMLPFERPGRALYHYPDQSGAATLNLYRDWVTKYGAGRICLALYGGENAISIAKRLAEAVPNLRPLPSLQNSPDRQPLEIELYEQQLRTPLRKSKTRS